MQDTDALIDYLPLFRSSPDPIRLETGCLFRCMVVLHPPFCSRLYGFMEGYRDEVVRWIEADEAVERRETGKGKLASKFEELQTISIHFSSRLPRLVLDM